jgi:hypothetical protein
MAAWPTLAMLKDRVDVDNNDHDTDLSGALAAGIAYVKAKVGDWDELVDVATDSQSHAALRAAEIVATRPGATPEQVYRDPAFQIAMYGSRRTFGIA